MLDYHYLQELGVRRFISRDKIISADILFITEQADQSGQDGQELLGKILASVQKLVPDASIRVAQLSNYSLFELNNYKFKKMIVFHQSNFDSRILNQLDSKNVLLAPSIPELLDNVELKKQLWQQLQIFCKI